MSENLALLPLDKASDSFITVSDSDIRSENAAAPKGSEENVDEDLEDGEIDDDDDNDEPIVVDSKIVVAAAPKPVTATTVNKTSQLLQVPSMVTVDMMNDSVKKSKSKKHQIVEDDFAGSIESAIAAALKKDGIMPPMPKILESRDDINEKPSEKDTPLSKSSRRRKRRKLRDEREKEKDKEKKKLRVSSPDITHPSSLAPAVDEELDDDEMLCVRGGSPPPPGLAAPFQHIDPSMNTNKEAYDSDDSYSSYDSYDSGHNYLRYSSARKKDDKTGSSGSRTKRKERGSGRREEERRSEKRNRRNYDDSGGEDKYQDRHPQQPRKLELCKFYLMECCAKKDKCSYMHSDFPCKYYYLGMDCVYRSTCKFSHGKPLTDQLRNVLLKHLETAPKEILGTFRRISRENAINFMNATHERICAEHGVENTLAPPTSTSQTFVQSQAGVMKNGNLSPPHQQLQKQQQPVQQQSQQSQPEIIPSLLDMVISMAPPSCDTTTVSVTTTAAATASGASLQIANTKSEKQRKSRWCDSASTNLVAAKQNTLEPPSSNAPSYLDLKNLTGILSTDHIEKLSQLGVVNLEQINQLTLSQLNKIGLTISEINEIQLNARDMAKLGVVGVCDEPKTTLPSINQDVDMRFLPSCLPLTTTTITTSTVTSEKPSDLSLSSPDPQPHPMGMVGMTNSVERASLQDHAGSSSAGGIDYSQYLRDSNLVFDKNDLDDEKDEEQLVIDDQDPDAPDAVTEVKDDSENDSKSSTSFSYNGADSLDTRLPPAIQLSDTLQNLLKDPVNLNKINVSALLKSNESASAKIQSDFVQSTSYEDDGFYSASSANTRRDTDTREEYRSIRHAETRDDYRDPRLTSKPQEQQRPGLLYRVSHSDDDSGRSRSQSPSPIHKTEHLPPMYERQTMYDWTPKCEQEDLDYSRRNTKADKDMRLSRFLDSSNSDIDLRLPFQPVKNIQIAKEIDGSMSTNMPIPYKILEISVPDPKYSDLRQSFQCDDSTDPRLRRILGLPELSNSKALVSLGRSSRPTIASPSSVESSSSPTREKVKPAASSLRGPRVDPRRAAATATASSSGATKNTPASAGNPQQNVEIRMLLQKSDWYKNLNSKYKIMVNQQLALVSTELKRFHQDPSPNKVFDIQFIVSNHSLQQILTNLGIYIDDNGQVAHIESDNDMLGGMGGCPGMDFGQSAGSNQIMMMNDPSINMQQRMALQQQIEFLRGPPPNMGMMGQIGPGMPGPQQGMFGNTGGGLMPQFARNARLGLLGMTPNSGGGSVGFNPFAGNPNENGGPMMDSNFCGPNNPFSNNFGGTPNFGGQQMNRGNRNNFNRQGSGPGGNMGNGPNRMNQNRRPYKPNNARDRRGGGNNVGANNNSSAGGNNNSAPGGNNAPTNQTTNGDEEEETWDDAE